DRVVIAGSVAAGAAEGDESDWFLARYTVAGARDASFGADGVLRTSFGTGPDQAWAAALQRDGRLVVGGSIDEAQALARYRLE
ncbi:MAG: hypothetical protein M3245_01770, partial [Actinomycetota bacterium]|nr:hypothetical protein [Actinomycetota bacterium]